MWGTMWIVNAHLGEKFMQHSRVMAGDASDIDIESIDDGKERDNVQNAITRLKEENIDWAGCAILDDYINEEMAGARCILDQHGNTTAAYIYEVAGDYVIGVHVAYAGMTAYDVLLLRRPPAHRHAAQRSARVVQPGLSVDLLDRRGRRNEGVPRVLPPRATRHLRPG